MNWKKYENIVGNHLFFLESNKEKWVKIEINDTFFNKFVMAIKGSVLQWYAYFENYAMSGLLPDDMNYYKRKNFLHDVKRNYWDEPSITPHH